MKIKVLIVEDEEALSSIVKEEFKSAGYDAKVAKDGEEALKFARSFHPNIMLLDLVLPKKII